MSKLYQAYNLFTQPRHENYCETIEVHISQQKPNTKRAMDKSWRWFTAFVKDELRSDDLNKHIYDLNPIRATQFMKSIETKQGFCSRGKDYKTLSPRTLQKELSIITSLFQTIISNHRLPISNPFEPLRKQYKVTEIQQRRPTKLTPYADVKRLIYMPGDGSPKALRDCAILAALYGGGLRRSEVSKLNMNNVKFTTTGEVVFSLIGTKNGTDAEQVISDDLSPVIESFYKHRLYEGAKGDDPLFVIYWGEFEDIQHNERVSDQGVYDIFKKWAKRAGLPSDVSPHSARATAITMLLEDPNIPRDEIKRFSRHATYEMLDMYDKRVKDASNHPGKKLRF